MAESIQKLMRRIFQMVMHEVRPGGTITNEWKSYQEGLPDQGRQRLRRRRSRRLARHLLQRRSGSRIEAVRREALAARA